MSSTPHKLTQKHQGREDIKGIFNVYCRYLNKKLLWQLDMYSKPKENVMFGLIHFSFLFNKLCSGPLTMTTVSQWREKNDKCFVEV